MAEVQSPQVITREIDVSNVAPSISSSIGAILGGAVKGAVNTPTFITTPEQFIESFGNPTTDSFLGLTAINFLRQGNQLWVNRVASLAGDDPVATANTNTPATILSDVISTFAFTGNLVIQFDNDTEATISFAPTSSSSLTTIANTINAALGAYEPKLGDATVESGAIKITGQSRNGELSRVVVLTDGTPDSAFESLDDSGERTVVTETALTAASITSEAVPTGEVDSTVTFATVAGAEYALTDTVNVSKQSREAFGIFDVSTNAFTSGVYNTATFQIDRVPDNTLNSPNEAWIEVNGRKITFESNAATSPWAIDVTAFGGGTGADTSSVNIANFTEALVEKINLVQSYTSVQLLTVDTTVGFVVGEEVTSDQGAIGIVHEVVSATQMKVIDSGSTAMSWDTSPDSVVTAVGGTASPDAVATISTAVASSYDNGYDIPQVGVKARQIGTGGSQVELTQIHPNPDYQVAVQASAGLAGYASWVTAYTIGDTAVAFAAASPSLGLEARAGTGGGTLGDYVEVQIPASVLFDTTVEDGTVLNFSPTTELRASAVGVAYYATAAADFSVSAGASLTGIADSIASYLASRNSYFASGHTTVDGSVFTLIPYAITATSSSNQITVATATTQKSTGNEIIVSLTNGGTSVSAVDLDTDDSLQHGFDERASYAFSQIVIDDVTYAINFDTISSTIIPNKHEASLQEVVDGINSFIGSNVAFVFDNTTSYAVAIQSLESGEEGTVRVTPSTNIGNNNDPYPGAASPLQAWITDDQTILGYVEDTGTGDNQLEFRIDEFYDVSVSFTQSATLDLGAAVVEINTAANSIDTSLATVATVDGTGTRIVLTSPTLGSFSEFGSGVRVSNPWRPNGEVVFGDASDVLAGDASTNSTILAEGSGDKVESITIAAASAGTWANGTIKVQFTDEDSTFYVPNSSRMDVYSNDVLVESFREVVINPDADGSLGTLGQGVYIEDAVNGTSDYVTVDFDDDLVDTDPDTLSTSVKIVQNTSILGNLPPYELEGGGDGIDGLTDADIIGVVKDDTTGNPTGLQVYADPDSIFINLLAAPGYTSQNVGNAMVTLAEARQDVLVILDPPIGLTPSEVVDWHNGQGEGRTAALNSSYATTYGSWIDLD
jgi:hypothetical protein